MFRSFAFAALVGCISLASAEAEAEEVRLFNGTNLDGWSLDSDVEVGGRKLTKDDVFLVQDGVMICRGGMLYASLRHEKEFAADYVLSLEWRWGPNIGSGTEISLHSSREADEVGRRKEIRVSLSVDKAGGIVYRGVPTRFDTQRERQTDREVEREMGEWNQLWIICRESKITVAVNGQPVNQVNDAPLSEGGIALGIAPVPIFYRNVKLIRPIGTEHARAEAAAAPLAEAWAKIEARRKADEDEREKQRLAEEQREREREERRVAGRNALIQSLRDAIAADDDAEKVPERRLHALPFPRDARDLRFNTTFGMIDFKSGSSLQALAAFYLRELSRRGWIEDESKATLDEDSIELTFEAAGATFELELDESSDYVDVSIDTEGVDFSGTGDPASLAASGIPQPRKALLLQKEIEIPSDAQRLSFDDDSCMFYWTTELRDAFAHFGDLLRRKGYRESRRPILSDTRNYTEFERGEVEVSVNIFTDPVGSRIILEYDDGKEDPVVPPLPDVGPTAASDSVAGNAERDSVAVDAGKGTAAVQVDVSGNQGTATVNVAGERFVFAQVAAFRSRQDIEQDESTSIVFSNEPIPFSQLQHRLATDESFSFVELSTFGLPTYLVVEVGRYASISVSVPGTGFFRGGIEDPFDAVRIEDGRVRGKLVYRGREDDDVNFSATVDAAILTPSTTLAPGSTQPVPAEGDFVDLAPPMPPEAGDFGQSGTNYSMTYTANAPLSVAAAAKFFRETLTAQNWQSVQAPEVGAGEEALRFRNATGTMTVRVKPSSGGCEISVTKHDDARAERDGVMPEEGKGRLILANAHTVPVVYSIGRTDYPLKAGAGAESLEGALNYSVGPGKYTIAIKIPGETPKTETIQISVGSTWAVIAAPTGGYLLMQLY